MRRTLYSIFLLLILVLPVAADNIVSVSMESGHPGDVVDVTVAMDNSDDIVAAEIRIPLNEHIKYVDGSAMIAASRCDGHVISAASVDNELRFFVYSLAQKPLTGDNGALISFKLKLGNSPENFSLVPDVILSDATGSQLQSRVVNGNVKIFAPHLTVTTNSIDYGHVPIRSIYTRSLTLKNTGTETLHVSNITFGDSVFSAADTSFEIAVGESKNITISFAPVNYGAVYADAVITSDASNGTQTATIVADPYSVNELHVGTASGDSDTDVEVAITLKNMEPIVAAQWTFVLPDDLRYVDGSAVVGSHAEGLQVSANVSGKNLNIYLYSLDNSVIEEGSGAIAFVRLSLQGRSGTNTLTPTDIILSNKMMSNMLSASSGGIVRVYSPTMSASSTLTMGRGSVTETVVKNYTILNSGQRDLVITQVTFLAEGYTIKEILPLTIPAGQTNNITVEYTAERSGTFATTMQVYSNDPQQRMTSVEVSGSTYEPNAINLSGGWNNRKYDLNISLENYSKIVAVQMDLHLPDGMTIDDVNTAIINTPRLLGLSSMLVRISDGVYRLAIFSLDNTPVNGVCGDIISVIINVSNTVSAVGKSIVVDNIILSDYKSKNLSSTLSVSHQVEMNVLLGDVNGDQTVNILDVLATLSIMKGDTGTFNQTAADANEDGSVNILDVLKILEIMKQQ